MKEIMIFAAGIVLFLFGMVKLSEGVQQLISVRIRDYIRCSVKKSVYGLTVGVVSTVLFQSSSATSVLAVGMVSAGLITFYHSLGIILGADIGTTVTVQLVVWKVTDISPVFIIAGGLLWLSGKDKWKSAGEAIFYFGLIFFGLSLAAMATAPLKHNQAVIGFIRDVNDPLLGLAIGVVFTCIVQASAIPISILVILSLNGLVTIENALPVVFGAIIGTTVTALLASAVANISGKRTAVSHFIFKCFGALVCMAAMPYIIVTLEGLSASAAQQIALGHVLFNVVIVVIFIFLLKPFSRFIEKVMPGEEEVLPLWPQYLDGKYLFDPEKALACVEKELHREIVLTQKMFMESVNLRYEYKGWKRRIVRYIESVIDALRCEIVDFLCKISGNRLSPELSRKLFVYTGMVDDIKRISNHAFKLADLSRDRYRTRVNFTEAAERELEEIERLTAENLEDAASLFVKRDRGPMENVYQREKDVDAKVKEARENHLMRYCQRLCHAQAGPIFVEMLLHLERISDLCHNVVEYIDELGNS